MAMMEELVKHVAGKAGLPEDQARVAVIAALEFMDVRLPPPFGGRLRYVVQGRRREPRSERGQGVRFGSGV